MSTLIDTGPLTALVDKRDAWHQWAANRVKEIKPPLITCEAVLSECSFVLMRSGIELTHLFNFISRGDLQVKSSFIEASGQERVIGIIDKYHNLPASFADACLVHMYEAHHGTKVFTLDSHFSIYRTSKGTPLSLVIPS